MVFLLFWPGARRVVAGVRAAADGRDPEHNRVRQDGAGLHAAVAGRPDRAAEDGQLRAGGAAHVALLRPGAERRPLRRHAAARQRLPDARHGRDQARRRRLQVRQGAGRAQALRGPTRPLLGLCPALARCVLVEAAASALCGRVD